jgi:long-chain acyl-CoA synthetase
MLSDDARRALADAAAREAMSADLVDLMSRTNADLDPHEQLEFAVVVSETWSIDNGFLTPTMKIRRNIIEKHYEPRLDGWYAARKKVIWETA